VSLRCSLSARYYARALLAAARPAFVFAELYARVESEQLFNDSKSFADAHRCVLPP